MRGLEGEGFRKGKLEDIQIFLSKTTEDDMLFFADRACFDLPFSACACVVFCFACPTGKKLGVSFGREGIEWKCFCRCRNLHDH